jgi:hypothetical protein
LIDSFPFWAAEVLPKSILSSCSNNKHP